MLAGGALDGSAAAAHGTGNYERPPVAVYTGGGFDDEAFAALREACLGVSQVPWLRPDMAQTEADGMQPGVNPEYTAYIADRVKRCLLSLADAGQIGQDGIVYF